MAFRAHAIGPAVKQAAPVASRPDHAPAALPHGRILQRALVDDPEQEYLLYVPPRCREGCPVFVAVHGISRNAREVAAAFAPYTVAHGVVMVVPVFPEVSHPDYQRLGRNGRGPRADLLLDAMVEEAGRLTKAETSRFYLFGYSGGAQFAHRYMMAHPHRVAAVVSASAGWYTFPTLRRRFPYGIRPSPDLAGVRFDPEEFFTVPVTVLVGDADTTEEGLRRRRRVDRQQGRTRVERARNWVAAMTQVAAAKYGMQPQVQFELIHGGGHSFAELMRDRAMGDKVFAALFSKPAAGRDAHQGNGNGKR
jgi:poly(3-hydroxybutyrate) depolymerase